MKFIVIFFFLFMYWTVEGQDVVENKNRLKVDSLWSEYTNNPNLTKTDSLSLLEGLADLLYKIPHAESKVFIDEFLQISRTSSDLRYRIKANIKKGNHCFLKSEFNNAKKYYERSLKYSVENTDTTNILINIGNIGMTYGKLGDDSQSNHYYMRQLNLLREMKRPDIKRLLVCYRNLAAQHYYAGRFIKAFEYAHDGINLISEKPVLEKRNTIGRLYLIAGKVLIAVEDYEAAKVYFNKAISICNSNSYTVCEVYTEMAKLAIIELDYDSAEYNINKAVDISMQWDNKDEITNRLLFRGKYYIKIEEYALALTDINKALDYSKITKRNIQKAKAYALLGQINLLDRKYEMSKINYQQSLRSKGNTQNYQLESEVINNLLTIYKKEKNVEEIAKYSTRLLTVNDSLLNKDKIRSIAKSEAKFNFILEKEKLQKNVIKYKNDYLIQKSKSKNLYFGITILSLLVLGIYTYVRRLKKLNSLIKNQSLTIKRKNKNVTEANEKIIMQNDLLRIKTNALEQELKDKLLLLAAGSDAIVKVKSEIIRLDLPNSKSRSLSRLLNDFTKANVFEQVENQYLESNKYFAHKLTVLHPTLTVNNIKLCILTKIGLTTKDISKITFKSIGSIKVAKNRLIKKMNLNAGTQLYSYLISIENDKTSM